MSMISWAKTSGWYWVVQLTEFIVRDYICETTGTQSSSVVPPVVWLFGWISTVLLMLIACAMHMLANSVPMRFVKTLKQT